MKFSYYVLAADGSVVIAYQTKAKAVAHAEQIGGSWFKARR